MKKLNTSKKFLAAIGIMGIAILLFSFHHKSGWKKIAQSTYSHSLEDPLPSWKDGPLKSSIITYVKNITNRHSNEFIPHEDRIATFDNDGTLWAEQPVIELLYAKQALGNMIKKTPALANQQPYRALISNDKAYLSALHESVISKVLIKSLSGNTEAEFDQSVRKFFDTAHYVLEKRTYPVKAAVYQPQLELLKYLRNNGFKTFICSGGTIEFVRAISMSYYGIPPEQVIGTKLAYEFDENSRKILRKDKIVSVCDKAGKPVNIQWHIGKIPVFACGNVRSGGDIQMLKFSKTSKYPMLSIDDQS